MYKVDTNSTISIINDYWNNLNQFRFSNLNKPIKRLTVDKKQGLTICQLQEIHFKHKDTIRLKVKGWRNTFSANNSKHRCSYISHKTDFRTRRTIRHKDGYYIKWTGNRGENCFNQIKDNFEKPTADITIKMLFP